MKRLKKSIWLTTLLLIYFGAMTFFFAPELIRSGQETRLYTVAGVEIVIIAVLFLTLRKKEQMNKRD